MAYTDAPFEELLDTIAAETPAPGGGSVAAFVTEMAASLAAMAARFAHDWDGAAGAVAQAETLRHRAAPLAVEDAVAYENVLTAMRMPKELEPEVRDTLIGETLSRAADVPLEIAETRRRRGRARRPRSPSAATRTSAATRPPPLCSPPRPAGSRPTSSRSTSRPAEGDDRVELALALVAQRGQGGAARRSSAE